MKIKINTQTVENSILLYSLLALACMNFLGHGNIVMLVFNIFALIKLRFKIKFDKPSYLYIALSLFVTIHSIVFFSPNDIIKALNYMLAYIVGVNCYLAATDKEKFIKRTMFAMFMGFSLNALLILIYNFLKFGRIVAARVLYSVWTGERVSVTLVGLLACVAIGYSYYAFFCNKKIYLKILSGAMLFIALYLAFFTATRTPFFMLVVVYFILLLIRFIESDMSHKIRNIIFLIIVVAAIFALYYLNVFNIKTTVDSSMLYQRLTGDPNSESRFLIATKYLKIMPKYIFGNGYLSETSGIYPHNYLQQTYDLYGLSSLVAMILVTIHLIKNFIALLNIKNKSNVDFLCLALFIPMAIQVLLEPVVTGYPILLWALFLLNGIVGQHLKNRSAVRE